MKKKVEKINEAVLYLFFVAVFRKRFKFGILPKRQDTCFATALLCCFVLQVVCFASAD